VAGLVDTDHLLGATLEMCGEGWVMHGCWLMGA
jgi:hypothetical protein